LTLIREAGLKIRLVEKWVQKPIFYSFGVLFNYSNGIYSLFALFSSKKPPPRPIRNFCILFQEVMKLWRYYELLFPSALDEHMLLK